MARLPLPTQHRLFPQIIGSGKPEIEDLHPVGHFSTETMGEGAVPFDGTRFDENGAEPLPQSVRRDIAGLRLWAIGCLAAVIFFIAAVVLVALG